MEVEAEPNEADVERHCRRTDGENNDDDDSDEGVMEWKSLLWDAIAVREASLEEIRELVLRQIPEAIRTSTTPQGIEVGAAALRAAIRLSGRRRRRRRRLEGEDEEREQRARQDRAIDLIKLVVEETGWGPAILTARCEEDKDLPLHVAILERCPPEVVLYLVNTAPGALQVRPATGDARGRLPIHLAVDRTVNTLPWETVRGLLDAWPESIHRTTGRGWYPLHIAVRHLRRNRLSDRSVVRGLIDRWPEALSRPTEDRWSQLPFHLAVSASVRVPDLQWLLNSYPNAIRAKASKGYLPLHLAFVHRTGTARPLGIADLSTLRFLVRQDPSTLKERTSQGLLPLHLAFTTEYTRSEQEAPSLDVVQLLVESCPESVGMRAKDPNGWTALHYAARHRSTPPDVIRYLIEKHPYSVQVLELGERRLWAVHIAVESDSSVAGIEHLIRAWPASLEQRTAKGELPIHVLLRRRQTRWRINQQHGNVVDTVRCLVAHCPSSVREKTLHEGMTPLHLALASLDTESPEGERVVEYLLEQWPESVHEFTTDRGWLALHCAAHSGWSPTILRSLLNLWPDSIHQVTRDEKQLLPIHLAAACVESTPALSLQCLLDAWPDSAMQMSGEGWLPIHYAASQPGATQSIEILLGLCPEMVRSATRNGLLPAHVALIRSRHDWSDGREVRMRRHDVIRCLVERDDPDVLLVRAGSNGSIALHLAVDTGFYDEDVVRYLVEACPEAVRYRDSQGSLPIHVALAHSRNHSHATASSEIRDDCRRVEALVALNPDSLLVADSQGRLPLHLAAESGHASLDVVYLLLRRCPEAIRGVERGADSGDGSGSGGRGRRPKRRPAIFTSGDPTSPSAYGGTDRSPERTR